MAEDEKKTDVVLLGPPTPDGEGVHVLRAREERIESGELRALKDGKPITGEVVSLAPRKENPRLCDVRSSVSVPSSATSRGPAQVASEQYRENWDQVFSRPDRTLN